MPLQKTSMRYDAVLPIEERVTFTYICRLFPTSLIQIVECAIVCGLNEMAAAHPSIDASTGKARPTVVSLSSIHATFEYVRRRLYSFGDMVRHRADIIRIIHSQISKDRKEMVRA